MNLFSFYYINLSLFFTILHHLTPPKIHPHFFSAIQIFDVVHYIIFTFILPSSTHDLNSPPVIIIYLSNPILISYFYFYLFHHTSSSVMYSITFFWITSTAFLPFTICSNYTLRTSPLFLILLFIIHLILILTSSILFPNLCFPSSRSPPFTFNAPELLQYFALSFYYFHQIITFYFIFSWYLYRLQYC